MKNKIKKISMGMAVLAMLISPVSVFAAPGDIVDKAIKTKELSTLVELVSTAGLVGALQEPNGDYTVFAPTNDAFAKMPRVVSRAIKNDPELLSKILLYHVVSGQIASSDVPRFARVETLQGDEIFARNAGGKVFVNASRVVIADVQATNGIVHVIDRVLIPWKEVFASLRAHK